jgi:hypothetical protein
MTRELAPFERYVDDLEEELVTEGSLGLHSFSWWLRGEHRALVSRSDVAGVEALCQQAYEVLTTRYALHLEWSDPRSAARTRAEADIDLDFDTRRDVDTTELPVPYLALVPDDFEATAKQVKENWARLAAEVRGG